MEPKNLVVIVDDQHNKKMLGCYGHPTVKTPNLDKLAKRGVRFSNAYTPSPICVSARAAAATGQYVHDIGCWDNASAYDGKVASWGHRLQQAGNRCVSIGKLHFRSEEDPTGFDKQIIPMHIAGGVGDLMGAIRPDLPIRYQSRKYVESVKVGTSAYIDYDLNIVSEAETWLSEKAQENDNKPWTVFISLIAPHFPLTVPKKYFDLYPLDTIEMPKPADLEYQQNHPWWNGFINSNIFDQYFKDDEHRKMAIACYLGLCTFTDENVGSILATLDKTGLSEKSRVIFFSDHGDNMGARGILGKSTMHEESARITMIKAGPDIPQNKVVSTPVSLVDLFPTVIENAGLETLESDKDLPGTSLISIARSDDQKDRVVFSEYHGAASVSGVFMLRKGSFKYIHYVSFSPELFDLEKDPEELTNLSEMPEYSEIIDQFRAILKDIVDPEKIDALAKKDQAALIQKFGGAKKIIESGGLSGTPVPDKK